MHDVSNGDANVNSCERFEELLRIANRRDWTDSELGEYLTHEENCPEHAFADLLVAHDVATSTPARAPEFGLLSPEVRRRAVLGLVKKAQRRRLALRVVRGVSMAGLVVALVVLGWWVHRSAVVDPVTVQEPWPRQVRSNLAELAVAAVDALRLGDLVGGSSLMAYMAQTGLDLSASPLTEAEQGELNAEDVAEICRLRQEGRRVEALAKAIEFRKVLGSGQAPLTSRFLMAEAGLLQEAPRVPDSKEDALLLVARMFREQPDLDPQSVGASAEFRRELLEVLEGDPVRIRRLYAMSALSGCGTPDVLPILYRIISAENSSREERRLALRCAGAIIRRSYSCGFIDQIDVTLAEDVIRTALTLPTKGKWARNDYDVMDFTRDVGCVARMSGVAQQFGQQVVRLLEEFGDPLGYNLLDTSYGPALASVQHPQTVGRIQAFLADLPDNQDGIRHLGRICGLYGNTEVTDEARNRCRQAGTHLVEAFELGVEDARGELEGKRTEFRPFGNPGDLTELLISPDGVNVGADILAEWSFQKTKDGHDVVASGEGIPDDPNRGFTARGVVSPWSDGSDETRVKLVHPGNSEIRLSFDTDADHKLVLEIKHLKRAHRLWPYDGVARISVLLDNRWLVKELAVTKEGWHTLRLHLDVQWLEPGEHTVSIRLGALATTAYTVESVRLLKTEDK